jgi:glutamyl-Q tRNA(Asp) synthetase
MERWQVAQAWDPTKSARLGVCAKAGKTTATLNSKKILFTLFTYGYHTAVNVIRGRFAPSPTGPLHFGSLVAAAASYVDARAAGGVWIVRMEDLDQERVQPSAADNILATLERFGFEWSGPVMWQSQRTEAYREAFARLDTAGFVYPCGCTRKEIGGPRYPGTCAQGLPAGRTARAWRVRAAAAPIEFVDRVQGAGSQNLAETSGDFVVRRADGLFAYQLAVVVDDAAQGITDVVRGADLLEETPRQIYLQQLLGVATPRYLHVPVATDAAGVKLSKQTRAPALDSRRAAEQIVAALRFLGQRPPKGLESAPPTEVWKWAERNWRVAAIPKAGLKAGCRLKPAPQR